MIKKTMFLILIIVISIFSISGKSKIIRLKKEIVYKNTKIMIPFDWKVQENDNSIKAVSIDDSMAEINLKIESMSSIVSLEEYIKSEKNIIIKNNRYKIISAEENIILYKTMNKGDEFLSMNYYFFEEKSFYILNFLSKLSVFEEYVDDFKIIADNFSVIKQEDDIFKDFAVLYEKELWNDRLKVSKEFEKIYLKNKDKDDFKNQLINFMGDDFRRYYWIGIFLCTDYYTKIFDYKTAEEILQLGIKKCESEGSTISFIFIIGLIYWDQGLKEESAEYFFNAFRLSEKYPGNIPAISSEKHEAINSYLEEYKKRKNNN